MLIVGGDSKELLFVKASTFLYILQPPSRMQSRCIQRRYSPLYKRRGSLYVKNARLHKEQGSFGLDSVSGTRGNNPWIDDDDDDNPSDNGSVVIQRPPFVPSTWLHLRLHFNLPLLLWYHQFQLLSLL
jgi:hypothetical protein